MAQLFYLVLCCLTLQKPYNLSELHNVDICKIQNEAIHRVIV